MDRPATIANFNDFCEKTNHGTLTVTCPGWVIWITPPQLHTNFDVEFKAGTFPINTVGDPGAQGAAVAGTHGIGVSTPAAAVVAAATVGFAGQQHMPNVTKLTIGLLSIIVAAGVPDMTRLVGKTTNGHGATPNEHWHKAPATTS